MPLGIFKNHGKSFPYLFVLTNIVATSQMLVLTFKLIKIKWNLKIQFLSHTGHIANALSPLLVAIVLNSTHRIFLLSQKILFHSADCVSLDFVPQSR